MWLLEHNTWQAMQAAIAAGVAPTAEQQAQFEATHISAISDGGSRILTVAGNSAEIAIKGVLTKEPSFLAMLFGGGNTTYSDIISAVNEAEQNPDVTDIIFATDSPGGSVDGLFDAISVIRNATKSTKTIILNVAASAAYGLITQTNEIVAQNNAVRVGSVGVLASFKLDENEVRIASTNAPKKNPDVKTEAGVAIVREELDAMHEVFVDAIAHGRRTFTKEVNANFGQGAMLLASEALKRGMIDSVTGPSLKVVKPTIPRTVAKSEDNIEAKSMDLKELKATHPEAYAAAVNVGVDLGITQERDRVGAHLIMGEQSGDMATALKACKEGTEMNATMQATYMSAGMNRNDIAAAGEDEAAAAAAADNANAEDDATQTDAETIASGLESRFGTEVKV